MTNDILIPMPFARTDTEVEYSDGQAARRLAVEVASSDGLIDAEHEMFISDLLDQELQAVFDAMDNTTRTHRACEAVAALLKRAMQRRGRPCAWS